MQDLLPLAWLSKQGQCPSALTSDQPTLETVNGAAVVQAGLGSNGLVAAADAGAVVRMHEVDMGDPAVLAAHPLVAGSRTVGSGHLSENVTVVEHVQYYDVQDNMWKEMSMPYVVLEVAHPYPSNGVLIILYTFRYTAG